LRLDDFTEVSLGLSKMGSALLDTTTEPAHAAPPAAPAEALRLQVAERLAAHRSRRGLTQARPTPATEADASRTANTKSARIAATVAERYAKSQSYRAFLAAEAERAIQQARAAAEVATLNAQAVAAAQQRLLEAFDENAAQHNAVANAELPHEVAEIAHAESAAIHEVRGEELSFWPESEVAAPAHPHSRPSHPSRPAPKRTASPPASEPVQAAPSATPANSGLTVRLYEDAASAAHVALGSSHAGIAGRRNQPIERNDAEALALDEEIAFRQAPVFEEPAEPNVPLPANLIEFPRQLVASRKARPRYAEGPLRDEADAAPADGQLRIFEVDPAQISTEPAPAFDDSPTPQWTAIWLDTPTDAAAVPYGPAYDPAHGADADDAYPTMDDGRLPQVAPIGRRVLAASINAAIILAGTAAFTSALVMTTRDSIPWEAFGSVHALLGMITGHVLAPEGVQPSMILGAIAAAGVFLYLLYQGLFFSLSESTPGMRCARIALCTFDDENPTRSAMRRRILAVLFSACTLGLGFLWATLDEERLAWHDRIARMYQRSY
jgi:uncharacterized RDD family membrane protein YckC